MQSCSLAEQMKLCLAASQAGADLFSLICHHLSYRWALTVIPCVVISVSGLLRLPAELNAAAAAACTQVVIFRNHKKSNILHASRTFSCNATCVLRDGFGLLQFCVLGLFSVT